MGKSTVFANGQGISNTYSEAVTVSAHDVCLTPVGPSLVPVPYTNVSRSASLVEGTKSVIVNGGMAAVDGCSYGVSTGDEAGIGKGVSSGTVAGRARFIDCSFDVTMEGRGVCRNLDAMTQNNGNALGVNQDSSDIPEDLPMPERVERSTFRVKVVEHLCWDAYDSASRTFRLGHKDNKPVAARKFRIEMPGGDIVEKTTDKDGVIELTDQEARGLFGIRFEPDGASLNSSYSLYYRRITPFETVE
jgi:hypothetical protein